MRRYDAGISGTADAPEVTVEALDLEPPWEGLLSAAIGRGPLRPVQLAALRDAMLLESRRNLVVSAPTNSGKSLVGSLAIADALRAGRRAILLEPLRALAQEKAEELRALWRAAGWQPAPRVTLSTGDYRLEHQRFDERPSRAGEVIVATPERLDALLRRPEESGWLRQLGCVVVDEAHLLGSKHRGPTLELVIAQLLSLASPPRLILLSATIGAPEQLQRWLEPCDLVEVTARTPQLKTEVLGLSADDELDAVIADELSTILEDEAARVLLFAYRRASTEAIARGLNGAGEQLARAYHSGLSASERAAVRSAFEAGDIRVVAATTSLALGVNLPATHVLIRDTTFYGSGRLEVAELLQMTGRAGRGSRTGQALIFVKESDDWEPELLAEALQSRSLAPLRSRLVVDEQLWRSARGSVEAAAQLVASCLARAGEAGMSQAQLQRVLTRTMAGAPLVALIPQSLRWLSAPERVISYRADQGVYQLTVLGARGCRSLLPLGFIAGFGTLLRDLLSVDPSDRLLSRWSPLDHLIVLGLLSDRSPSLRRFSEKLAAQLDGWHASRAHEERSLIFGEWIAGAAGESSADELAGSLGLTELKDARKAGYLAALTAAILDARARGESVRELEERWKLSRFRGVEEGWRDTVLWLLAGQAQLCELRCFYYHLLERCGADRERIQRVKRLLRAMRRQAYELMEALKYCSPLGPLMRGVREMLRDSAQPMVGVGTIRRLEGAGFSSLAEVGGLSVDELVELGVQRRFAKQIRAHLQRRLS